MIMLQTAHSARMHAAPVMRVFGVMQCVSTNACNITLPACVRVCSPTAVEVHFRGPGAPIGGAPFEIPLQEFRPEGGGPSGGAGAWLTSASDWVDRRQCVRLC